MYYFLSYLYFSTFHEKSNLMKFQYILSPHPTFRESSPVITYNPEPGIITCKKWKNQGCNSFFQEWKVRMIQIFDTSWTIFAKCYTEPLPFFVNVLNSYSSSLAIFVVSKNVIYRVINRVISVWLSYYWSFIWHWCRISWTVKVSVAR